MRPPDMAQQQYQQMLRMQNGAAAMNMQMKPSNLARTAMANNQNKYVSPPFSFCCDVTFCVFVIS